MTGGHEDDKVRPEIAIEQFVTSRNLPHRTLRSVKVAGGQLVTDRLLWSIPTKQLEQPAGEFIGAFAAAFGGEPLHRLLLSTLLDKSRRVHLGYERRGGAVTYRWYLELDGPPYLDDPMLPGQGLLTHVAMKWRSDQAGGSSLTAYRTAEITDRDELLAAVRAVFSDPEGALCDATCALISLALPDVSIDDVQRLLWVHETGSFRKSFDLRLSNMDVGRPELLGRLKALAAAAGLGDDDATVTAEVVAAERVQRLAGGVDRLGDQFITLYFGAKRSAH